MKAKDMAPEERSEYLRKWKENMEVTCADCGETVRAKDAAHARTARGLPNYICNTCLKKSGLLC